MLYSCDCDKRECEYKEVEEFIGIINDHLDKNFFLKYCPDAQKCKEYNADLEYYDAGTNEALYIEVKEVHIGYFGQNQGRQKGEDNGRQDCALLVSQAIDCLSEEQQEALQDFVVTIPQTFISKRDKASFREQLSKDMEEIDWDSQDSYSTTFNGKSGPIKIDFDRKTDEIYETFGQSEDLLFAYENGDGHPRILNDIFEQLTDTVTLVESLKKNAQKTGSGKFPPNDSRKILLNILKTPMGNEAILNALFLKGYEGILLKAIKDNEQNFISAATESYLLWYCDEYYQNIDSALESIAAKPVLLCIPLIGEFINQPTLFDLSTTEQ